MAWTKKEVAVTGGLTLGASSSGTASSPVSLSGDGALQIVVDINVAAYTGTVTLKLQDAMDTSSGWVDKKSITVAATGRNTIKLLATDSGDWTHLPLRKLVRVQVTTAAASSVTIDKVTMLVIPG